MSFLDWNEKSMVNHPTMDKEHKLMVDNTNKLYSLIMSNENNKDTINQLFLQIVNELKIHFETEERLMKESKTPFYISHKLEHDRFYNKMKSLQQAIASGKETLNTEHLEGVKVWFFNHLDFKDRQLAEFLTENNIQ